MLTPQAPSAPVCVQMSILSVSLRLAALAASTEEPPPTAQNHHLKQQVTIQFFQPQQGFMQDKIIASHMFGGHMLTVKLVYKLSNCA